MAVVFTDAGADFDTDLFDGTLGAPTNYYLAIGTDNTAANAADTALGAEVDRTVATTEDQPTSNQNRWIATFTASGPATITEAGLFTAAAAGTMPVRSVFAGIAWNTNDQIQVTITLSRT